MPGSLQDLPQRADSASSFTSVRNSIQAIDLLRTGRIRVDQLVSHRLPLEELQRGIEVIEGGVRGQEGADPAQWVKFKPSGINPFCSQSG
jgi:hypothetical protein